MLHKAWNCKGEMPYCFPRSSIKFQGHTGQNITDFDPNWAFPDYRPVAAFKSLRFALFISPTLRSCWGVYWFHSVRPSIRPASRVHSVAPTVLVDPLHIYTSYQVTSKGVLRVKFLAKFWLCLLFTWDLMWITSMGNHGAVGGISERRRFSCFSLNHWGWVTHICISKLTVIGSDNGLSPGGRQAIIWTNAGILFVQTLGRNFSETLSQMHTFSFKKMHLKMLSVKWWPFCLSLNVLILRITANQQKP